MTILERIVAHKRAEVSKKRARRPKFEIQGLPFSRDFASALSGEGISLIAEIKRFSPSKRIKRPNFDPTQIARDYQRNGAAAISILTDEKFFGGRDSYVNEVREAVGLPILRKEFIVDQYQLYESRSLGADCVLLIAALWDSSEIASLLALAEELGLSCLVEAHTEEEVAKILNTPANIIGINNRNLATLEIDLTTSLRLRSMIPPGRIAVSESGVRTRENILSLQKAGFDAVLIGESLMSSPDITLKTRELFGK